MLREPSGRVARYCKEPCLYIATVVVSAPKSTIMQPRRRSSVVSTRSASARGRIIQPAILRLSLSSTRRSMFRLSCGRQVMRLAHMRMSEQYIPSGCSARELSIKYSLGTTSRMSFSVTTPERTSSFRRSSKSAVTSVSGGILRSTSAEIEERDLPPMPTYTHCTRLVPSLFCILRSIRSTEPAATLMLLTCPQRTQSIRASSSTILTVRTPSGLTVPTAPQIFELPISRAIMVLSSILLYCVGEFNSFS